MRRCRRPEGAACGGDHHRLVFGSLGGKETRKLGASSRTPPTKREIYGRLPFCRELCPVHRLRRGHRQTNIACAVFASQSLRQRSSSRIFRCNQKSRSSTSI